MLLVATATSCGSERVTPLAHTAPSPAEAARGVLAALAAGDRARLLELALTEPEFRDVVWPELPTSRPEVNLPVEYAWGELKQKSDHDLGQTLARYGGQRLHLIKIEFTGDTTGYDSYLVRRKSRLTVRDGAGHESQIQVFGSMLETADGRFKVFSYVVD